MDKVFRKFLCPTRGSVNLNIIDRNYGKGIPLSLTCDEEPASDQIADIGVFVYGHPCFKLDS